MLTTRRLSGIAGVAAIAVCLACAETPPRPPVEATPADRALALFDLAAADDLEPERVEEMFGVLEDEQARATLLDAITELQGATDIVIVETYTIDDLDRSGFELEGQLPGGGSARFSLQLDVSTEPGTIVWFSGPGIEWPDRRRRGNGLSTSAPPETPAGG